MKRFIFSEWEFKCVYCQFLIFEIFWAISCKLIYTILCVHVCASVYVCKDPSGLYALSLHILHDAPYLNTLRPRQNGRHFADDILKCIFLNENVWIPIEISLNFVPKGPINNIPALVQIMAWRRSGDKPLSEPMMVGLTTHICVLGLNELTNLWVSYSSIVI